MTTPSRSRSFAGRLSLLTPVVTGVIALACGDDIRPAGGARPTWRQLRRARAGPRWRRRRDRRGSARGSHRVRPRARQSGDVQQAGAARRRADCAEWHACKFQNAATALRSERARPRGGADRHDAAEHTHRVEDRDVRVVEDGALPVRPRREQDASTRTTGAGSARSSHPWPDLNRCQVETQVATKSYQTQGMRHRPSERPRALRARVPALLPGRRHRVPRGLADGQAWSAHDARRPRRRRRTSTRSPSSTTSSPLALETPKRLARRRARTSRRSCSRSRRLRERAGGAQRRRVVAPLPRRRDQGSEARRARRRSRRARTTRRLHSRPSRSRTFARTSARSERCSRDAARGRRGHRLRRLAHRRRPAGAGRRASSPRSPLPRRWPTRSRRSRRRRRPQFRALYDALKGAHQSPQDAASSAPASPLNLKLPASVASDTD